jgi:hypothetical protein
MAASASDAGPVDQRTAATVVRPEGRVRIEAITIAVGNLAFTVFLAPISHSCGYAICEQIHRTAALQVHVNRSFPPSPLTDTSEPDRGSIAPGSGVLLETPNDRGVAHSRAHPGHQSRRGAQSIRKTLSCRHPNG